MKFKQAWEERELDKREAREEGHQKGLEEGRQEGACFFYFLWFFDFLQISLMERWVVSEESVRNPAISCRMSVNSVRV